MQRIEIVDHGRGPQLSTSRITVQDLVPYFKEGYSHEDILRWVPALTPEELAVIESYYREHKAELDEEDRRIGEYVADQIRQQRLRIPEETRESRMARMTEVLRRRQEKANGQGPPG
jgi:uncharacterized protein (DUF433 family)